MPRLTTPARVPARPTPRMRGSSAKDRPSRLKLLLRRQRRLARPLGLGVVLLGLIVIGYGAMHGGAASRGGGGSISSWRDWVGRMAGMRVQTITIEGRANTPEPLLRAALGVAKGDPILGISVEAARLRIEGLSWVEHAVVERRLPGTIAVALVERRPFAIWQNQGKFELIDRAGAVVANEDVSAFGELPLVVGTGAPAHAADLLDALQAVPDIRARVAAAVRVGERRWNLQLKNTITVMLPEGAAPAALQRLSELQVSGSLLDRPIAAVDLRLPDRLVVRPLQSTSPATTSVPKRST